MKGVRVLSILIILLAIPAVMNAQLIQGALMGGLNLTQVDGDEVYGFHKAGATIGASAIIPFSKKWSVSIETNYTQKGSYQEPQYNDSLTYEYKLQLDYVEVPVLVHFTDKERLTVGAGFSWGRLVDVKEYEHGYRVETTSLLEGPYDRDDFSILADLKFRLYHRFHFNVRYSYSLSHIRTREFTVGTNVFNREQFNNVISFRLIYNFNEILPDHLREGRD